MFKVNNKRVQKKSKNILFPIDLEKKIISISKRNNTTFSSFVIQACEFAIIHLKENDNNQNEKQQ